MGKTKDNSFIFILFAIVVISSIAITSMFSAYYISEQLSPLIIKIKNLEKTQIELKEIAEIRVPGIEKQLYEDARVKMQSFHKKLGGLTGRMKVMETRLGLADEEYLKLLEQLEQSYPLSLEYKPQYNINRQPERKPAPTSPR